MLSHEAYFGQLDAAVRAAMFHFAKARQQLRLAPDDAGHQAALLKSANDLLRLGFETCGVALPSAPFAAGGDFTQGVRTLAATEVPQGDAATACLSELRKLVAAVDLEEPAPLPALDSPSSAALAFVLGATGILCHFLFGLYSWRSHDPRLAQALFTAPGVEVRIPAGSLDLLKGLPERLTGWCSYDKAVLLYSLVRKYRPEKAVEIGVFGGRSIVPIALALRDNRFGHVVGIESWAAEPIATFRTSLANDFWWATTDFVGVKRAFLAYIVQEELHPYIRLLETTSDRGLAALDEIQFAHIDGGHSLVGAAQDVAAVLARMPAGGVIVFDDIDWHTTRAAVDLLMDTCRLIHVVGTYARPETPGCAAFVKL